MDDSLSDDSDAEHLRNSVTGASFARGIDLSRILPSIRSEAIRLALGMRSSRRARIDDSDDAESVD